MESGEPKPFEILDLLAGGEGPRREEARKILSDIAGRRLEDSDLSLLSELVESPCEKTSLYAKAVDSFPPQISGILIDRAFHLKDVPLLIALSEEVKSKENLKAVKKAIHKLKSQGISFPQENPESNAQVFTMPAEESISEALTTQVDFYGRTIVAIFHEYEPRVVAFIHAMVSDHKGLLDIETSSVTRRGAKMVIREMRNVREPHLIPEDPARAAKMIMESSRLSTQMSSILPGNFAQCRKIIEKLAEKDLSVEWTPSITEEDVRSLVSQSQNLNEVPELRAWGPDREFLSSIALKIEEVSNSGLVLSEAQKIDQIGHIFLRAAEKMIETEGVELLAGRLRQLAYFFHKKGKEDIACALAVVSSRVISGEIPPFVVQMLRKGFRFREAEGSAQEIEQGKEKGEPLIWTP